MTDFNTQDGSRAVVVTETGVVKNGRGVLKGIVTTATSSGTLIVKDGTEESVVAVGTITQSVGAATPASHATSKLTSSGAMVEAEHATSVLTGDTIADTNIVVIGEKTYTFKLKLIAGGNANEVFMGEDTEAALANLVLAINGTGTPGLNYGTGTVADTNVVATTSDATTMTVYGRVIGTSLNAIATTGTALRTVWADTTLGGGTGASDPGVAATNATVTIDEIVYTVVDILSETNGADAVAYQVLKGVSEATMLDNIKAAINASGTVGTEYSTGTVAHIGVIATTNTDTTQIIVARVIGDNANSIATTETMANTAWADTTLGGGTGDSNPGVTTDAATITIGTRVYTAVIELTEASGQTAVADQILWVTSEAVFLDNLKKAINQTGVAGTDYSTGTLVNAQVKATTNGATTQVIEARVLGANGNAIATTATLTNYAWGTATLASGTGADAELLLNTYTPAAGDEINLQNLEFTRGLFISIGGTSISSTIILK